MTWITVFCWSHARPRKTRHEHLFGLTTTVLLAVPARTSSKLAGLCRPQPHSSIRPRARLYPLGCSTAVISGHTIIVVTVVAQHCMADAIAMPSLGRLISARVGNCYSVASPPCCAPIVSQTCLSMAVDCIVLSLQEPFGNRRGRFMEKSPVVLGLFPLVSCSSWSTFSVLPALTWCSWVTACSFRLLGFNH